MTENEAKAKSILIVEDDNDVREFLVEKFSREGFVVHHATQGEEGLDAIRRVRPSVVLTDLMMPTMNGLDFIRLLREHHRDIDIVVVSGLASARTEAWKLGVSYFIDKPFDGKALSKVVNQLLDKSAARKVS